MEQLNRVLTFIFVLIFAFGVAFFIFYRLGLFQKIFPQAKVSLPAFFSSTKLTPTPTPTPDPGTLDLGTNETIGQENYIATNFTPQAQPPEPYKYTTTATPPTRQIPGTGSPTILLPILVSLFGFGIHLQKKL